MQQTDVHAFITLTCSAFAANLKTFSLSTSIISCKKWKKPRSQTATGDPSPASPTEYHALRWPLLLLFVFSSCFLRLSSLSEKLMPCRLCLLSWHAIRVQRLWIIRRCSAQQINTWAESCFIISNTETTHIVDSTFRIQEEQLNRNDVLQMCYVFDIKPVKDKSRCDAEADCSLSQWVFFFFGSVCVLVGTMRGTEMH